jgi:hypothetical protein
MPTLHLIVDEVVPVDRSRFRVRLWREAGYPPVVLSSQRKAHPPPDWCSSQLANHVLRCFLGFSLPIPVFYEFSRWNGKARAFRVTLEAIGCELRPVMINPQYEPIEPQVFEQLFKVRPDNPNQGAA